MKKTSFILTAVALVLLHIGRNLWFTFLDRQVGGAPMLILKLVTSLLFILIHCLILQRIVRYFLQLRGENRLIWLLYGAAVFFSLLLSGIGSVLGSETLNYLGKLAFVMLQSPVPLMILFFGFYLKRASGSE